MAEITLKDAELLDKLLSNQIELQTEKRYGSPLEFSMIEIKRYLEIDDQLAEHFLEILLKTVFNNVLIVKQFGPTSGNVRIYYNVTDRTKEFKNSGGYTKIFHDLIAEEEKLKEKEELELNSLRLGPKQHRFNKISVLINATLTIITIILSILIALKIIGKS